MILSGGNDLNSLNPNPLSSMRDEYEAQILTHCLRYNLPLLGICRGAQRIAEYFGAKLELLEGHIGNHQVVDTSSGEKFEVNSFHNYGIRALGDCLEPLVRAEDRSIEAFKHKHKPIFAMMWHIEREGGMQAQEGQNQSFDEWLKIVTIRKEKE